MKDKDMIKQLQRIVSVQREQLELLNCDTEQTPQTEIEPDNDNKKIYSKDIDIYEYNKFPEGTEVIHKVFTNTYNEPREYYLVKDDVNKCLYKEI